MVQEASKLLELGGFQENDLQRLSNALRAGARVEFSGGKQFVPQRDMAWLGPMINGLTGVDDASRKEWLRWRAPCASEGKGPGVTVVIPSHRQIPIGLAGWLNQDVPVRVLILSNGPQGPQEAGTAEVVRLPWKGHGATRQAAVEMVQDDYILLTVDDAVPLGAGFVRRLVNSLEAPCEGLVWDAMVARQLPWPDADRVTTERIRKWTPAKSAVFRMPQSDHVCTLYRTADLRAHPLPAVPIAEDAWWSIGKNIGCDPLAPVVHSHSRKPRPLYRRNRDIHRERVRMGLTATVSGPTQLLRAIPATLRPLRYGQPLEVLNQVAELFGQYRGAHLGDMDAKP